MNQYTDIQILECNRLHSEEAKAGNNENTALWQNNLQDIVHLSAGDRVSVYGAMINEKGAGGDTIEIKGVNTGVKKSFSYINVSSINASDFLPTGYEQINCSQVSEEIDIRDDTLTFVQSYYQTANARNYMHLPRKWWYNASENSNHQWSFADKEASGMSRHFVNVESDLFSFKSIHYPIDMNAQATPPPPNPQDLRYMKPVNDNKRYTIMMREYSFFSEQSASDNYQKIPIYNEGARDPENSNYFIYKELKQIKLPKGFNSPDYVANEVSRQMQEIVEEKLWKKGYYSSETPAGNITTPTPFYRTITTQSYKPFNVAYLYKEVINDDDAENYGAIQQSFEDYYVNASWTISGWEYLSQYHVIGCDKPDLREAGVQINEKFIAFGQNTNIGILGSELLEEWTDTSNVITLDIAYNKDYCDKIKKFFDTQTTYPEIWEYFKETDNNYNPADTINNSRWLHINRWKNASLTKTASADDAQLGDSYYTTQAWHNTNKYYILNSALLPIYYDSSQKDVFHPYNGSNRPLINENKFSYGCISSNASGYVVIKATENNGIGSALYTELLSYISGETPVDTIEAGRKIGFDMHFNAPALSYILPYAGYTQQINSFQTEFSKGTYNLNQYDYWSEFKDRGYRYVNKLYFGATTPELNWDGRSFSLSGLHTPLNRSQNVRNKDKLQPAYTDQTDLAGDVVYLINPEDNLIDWTPARKPYFVNAASNASGQAFSVLNPNLVPWQIYDNSTGIFISDFNLTEKEWTNSLWSILGFSYKQSNSPINNRLIRTDNKNVNNLQLVTTNAEIGGADSKLYVQNAFGAPLYSNMMPISFTFNAVTNLSTTKLLPNYPPIIQKTQSISIIAENLPTRMIRGYYCIRSNVLQQTPFIGGKVNNTTMPIIGVVNKITPSADFYTQGETSLEFTITKPVRLASITTSIHDPDGSYANVGDQSTVLIKIQRPVSVTFDVATELMQEKQQKK